VLVRRDGGDCEVGSETAPEHERKSVDGREGLLSQMETPASSLNSALRQNRSGSPILCRNLLIY
jgi:hypothetical protein